MFLHLWVVELTYRYIFSSNSLSGVSCLILFPLFATGVIDTGSKFTAVDDTVLLKVDGNEKRGRQGDYRR
jgi:hypothetical protein